MLAALHLAFVVSLQLLSLIVAQTEDARVLLSPSGTFSKADAGNRRQLARAEMRQQRSLQEVRASSPLFSPLQIGAEVSARTSNNGEPFPWPVLPLCQFEAEGDFSSLVRVFVNDDNTRAFVFDRDAKGSQSKVQCHGATPQACLRPHLLANGEPDNCENHDCSCVQATLSMETIHSNYVRQMVHKVGPYCSADGGANILNIGLGGAAMSTYLLDNCKEGTKITSIEKDPRIIAMARKFFGLKVEPGRNDIENLDAGEALQRHVSAGDLYDVVLIDCFGTHGTVPESCRSEAFVRDLSHVLKPSGMVIQQVWTSQYSDLFHNYNTVFGHEHLSAEPVDIGENYLLIATAGR